jgi:cell division protein FtsW (lipid II flippase)
MKPVRVQSRKPKKQQKWQKERKPKRWLLNAFLYLLIFINGMIVLITFAAIAYQSNVKTAQADLLTPQMYAYGMGVALVTIFFLINLLQLRRWAFWGYCACAIGSIILNVIIGSNLSTALLGLGGPIIVFGLLYMGGRRSAWCEMERNKKI